jgi:hypothetical protein
LQHYCSTRLLFLIEKAVQFFHRILRICLVNGVITGKMNRTAEKPFYCIKVRAYVFSHSAAGTDRFQGSVPIFSSGKRITYSLIPGSFFLLATAQDRTYNRIGGIFNNLVNAYFDIDFSSFLSLLTHQILRAEWMDSSLPLVPFHKC